MNSYANIKTLTVLLLAALALGACKDKSPDQAQNADADANADMVDQASTATEAAEPELPNADYWKPVSTLVARNYGDGCVSGLEMKPTADTIAIAADGELSVGSFSTNLLKVELKFSRNTEATAASSHSLAAGDDDFLLGMMTRNGGQGDNVMLKYGEKVLTCDKAKNVLPLADKSLYSLYASFIDSPARKIRCIKAGSVTFADIDYQIGGGVAKIQDETYDLAKMSSESVTIGKEQDSLAYHAMYSDKRAVLILLDRTGKLQSVYTMGKGGESVHACGELNHG